MFVVVMNARVVGLTRNRVVRVYWTLMIQKVCWLMGEGRGEEGGNVVFIEIGYLCMYSRARE